MNLIEQQNVLRNLPDEALSTAMQGGGMPPYLVLTEINRRKQVREHYLSQKQKYDAAQPSVAAQTVQDFSMASQGMMPPDAMLSGGIDAAAAPMVSGAPAAPAGIDAVAPEGFKNGGSVPGYANGTGSAGIPMAVMTGSSLLAPKVPTTARDLSMTPVYSDPYASLREYFASQAGAMDKEREQAQAMALIAAGLGIAGGKSQNFARNLAGALPALEGYQKQMSDISQNERQFGLEKAKLDAQSAEAKTAWEQAQPEYKQAQLRKQLIDAGFDPNSEEFKYYLTGLTPPTPASSDLTPDRRNYEYYVSQEIAADRVPKSFEEFTKGAPKLPASTEKRINELNDKVIAGDGAAKMIDEALALNDKSYDNLWAEPVATAASVWGDEAAKNTLQLKNATIGMALEQLKSTFGAMPTEGERQVLIDFQGSISQPREVRERIYKRAKEKVALRLEMNRREAEALQNGEKFSAFDAIRDYEKNQSGAAPTVEDVGQAPEGVSQDLWNEMTPEERALWQD